MPSKYPIKTWRTAYDIAACWLVIAVSLILVIRVSWWLYPIAAVLIANRILALSLLCHEGLHGNLHGNLKINDFIGRYFCAFPSFVSYSKYRRLHLLHHGTIGSDKWDPDRHLYEPFPKNAARYVREQAKRLFTLKIYREFLDYYLELPELLSRKRLPNGRLFVFSPKSDLIPFVIFQICVLALVVYFGFYFEYLTMIVVPMVLVTQPYVYLMGGLQHGPVPSASDAGFSRSIRGSKLYMWLVLPCDICFHAEHHLNSGVPHYWLKKYSHDLEASGVKLWKGSYAQAVRELFTKNTNPESHG